MVTASRLQLSLGFGGAGAAAARRVEDSFSDVSLAAAGVADRRPVFLRDRFGRCSDMRMERYRDRPAHF